MCDFFADVWPVLAAAIVSSVYAVACEVIAQSPALKANSVLQAAAPFALAVLKRFADTLGKRVK